MMRSISTVRGVILLCAFALLLGGTAAFAAPAQDSIVYKPDGNRCPRQDGGLGGGAGRDVIPSSNNPAILLRLPGHADSVKQAFYSSNGKTIITLDGKAIRLWDATSGKNLKRHPIAASSAALSPDGKVIATPADGGVLLFNAATGKEIGYVPSSDGGSGAGVAFSPNGRMLAGFSGRTAYVWDAQTGEEVWRLEGEMVDDYTMVDGHVNSIFALRFTPNGQALLTSGGDATVRMWDLRTGEHIRCYEGALGLNYSAVDISPDGRTIGAITHGGLALWDSLTGDLVRDFDPPANATFEALAFNPNNKALLAATSDYSARLFDYKKGTLIGLLRHPTDITVAAFSPLENGRRALTAAGKEAWVWDTTHKNVTLAAQQELRKGK